jgi:hypothetical protein
MVKRSFKDLFGISGKWLGLYLEIFKDFGVLFGNFVDRVDVSYTAPQARGIVNVAALHRGYSPGIIFIFSQGRKNPYHV